MDRSLARHARHLRTWMSAALAAAAMVTSTGCLHSILTTGIYLWQGGDVVPAECDQLQGQRVVVVCRPPSSNEYRHAGAARDIGKKVSQLLKENVPKIDVVSPSEVDNWIDEQDWDNFKDLGRAVKATRIVYIELENFDLYKGSTLYQGDAEVKVTVFDMTKKGDVMWERNLGQILFPRNSGIPAADKPIHSFQAQFVGVLADQIAVHFYKHNPNASFALDAVANR